MPWHQDEKDNWVDVPLTVEIIKDLGLFQEIHDLGCGFDNYLALIQKQLGAAGCQSFGYDFSETACIKAKNAFPELSFQQIDFMLCPDHQSANYSLFEVRSGMFFLN